MRYGLASLMATIAVLLSVVAVPGRYVENTLYDTDQVVEHVATTLDDQRVQTVIANKVTDQLFTLAEIDRAEAESVLKEVADLIEKAAEEGDESYELSIPGLDPEIFDLVADLPIAEALQTDSTQMVVDILATGRLTPALLTSVRTTHEAFVNVLNEEGLDRLPEDEAAQINIDLEPVLNAALAELADDPVLGFLSNAQVPVGSGDFVIAHDGQGSGLLWSLLRGLPDWTGKAVAGSILLLIAAVALSPERDRIMLGSGVAIACIALLTIGAVWAARAIATNVFIREDEPQGAFDAVYKTLADPLVSTELRVALLGGILAAFGGVLGLILDWQADRSQGSGPTTGIVSAPGTYQSPYENQPTPRDTRTY